VRFGGTTATMAVLAAFVLAACGGKGDSAKPTTTTRFPPTVPVRVVELSEGNGVCGLLTQAEVAAATRLASQRGSGSRGATSESCRWNLTGTSQFVLLLQTNDGPAQFDRARDAARGGEALNGVGDRAFISNDTVYVQKGPKVLVLQVLSAQGVPQRKEAATTLMRMAAARV